MLIDSCIWINPIKNNEYYERQIEYLTQLYIQDELKQIFI